MEPIKYFDAVDMVEPHCKGCQHIMHYDKDATFDNEKQVLNCRYCGTVL